MAKETPQFKCSTCVKEEREMADYQKAKMEQAGRKRQHEISTLREKRLEGLPEFNKPEIIGFPAGNASYDAVCTIQ
jgi:hypothetical protein